MTRMRPWQFLYGLSLFFLFLGMSGVPSAQAELEGVSGGENGQAPRQEVVQAALQGLKSAVDRWGAQDFSSLYEGGTLESRRLFSKERFVSLMKNSTRQLQCCWTTLQELQGFFRSPTQVYVEAMLGYENFQNTGSDSPDQDTGPAQWVISSSFDPRTFLMVLQQGRWRIDLTEVLLASGYLPESLGMDDSDIP
jgi:hypothetical protein